MGKKNNKSKPIDPSMGTAVFVLAKFMGSMVDPNADKEAFDVGMILEKFSNLGLIPESKLREIFNPEEMKLKEDSKLAQEKTKTLEKKQGDPEEQRKQIIILLMLIKKALSVYVEQVEKNKQDEKTQPEDDSPEKTRKIKLEQLKSIEEGAKKYAEARIKEDEDKKLEAAKIVAETRLKAADTEDNTDKLDEAIQSISKDFREDVEEIKRQTQKRREDVAEIKRLKNEYLNKPEIFMKLIQLQFSIINPLSQTSEGPLIDVRELRNRLSELSRVYGENDGEVTLDDAKFNNLLKEAYGVALLHKNEFIVTDLMKSIHDGFGFASSNMHLFTQGHRIIDTELMQQFNQFILKVKRSDLTMTEKTSLVYTALDHFGGNIKGTPNKLKELQKQFYIPKGKVLLDYEKYKKFAQQIKGFPRIDTKAISDSPRDPASSSSSLRSSGSTEDLASGTPTDSPTSSPESSRRRRKT